MKKITGIAFKKWEAAANVAGRKTQHRPMAGLWLQNINPELWEFAETKRCEKGDYWANFINSTQGVESMVKSPYGGPGDIIWQREAYCYVMSEHGHDLLEGMTNQFVYKNSVHPDWMEYAKEKYGYKWKPAIHMPKEACRWWGEIISVGPERLADTNKLDAVAEGVEYEFDDWFNGNLYIDYLTNEYDYASAVNSFRSLVQSIHNKPGKPDIWEANPWVWRIEYKATEKPDNFLNLL